jgi:hypothetical protein
MLRLLLGIATFVVLSGARAGGLERLDQVDLIELDPKTSQLQLLVLLEEDRVDSRPAVRALYKKFNNYQDFIDSGQALAAAPNASKTLRPVVVVVAPRDATSGEMQNLAGLKLAASKVRADVEVRPYTPGIRAKPIVIERAAKRGA